MKNYRNYNVFDVAVVGFLVVFVCFLGIISFYSGPQDANATLTEGLATPKPASSTESRISRTTPTASPVNTANSVANKPLAASEKDTSFQALADRLSEMAISASVSSPSSNLASTEPTPVMSNRVAAPSVSPSSGSPEASSDGSISPASGSTGSSTAPGSDSSTPSGDGTDGAATDPTATDPDPTTDTTTPNTDTPVTPSQPVEIGGGSPTNTVREDLKKLEPLPKIHYSWPLVATFLSNERETACEVARITHALSVSGENVREEVVDACVAICAEINKTNPEIPCSLGINYSPWRHIFRPDLPHPIASRSRYNYTIFNHPTYNDEIEQFVLRMTLIKKWVSQSNKKYRADVKVGALLLDCERFERRLKDPSWNERMGIAQNDIHVKAVEIFPDARIEWYDRGMRPNVREDDFNYACYLADNAIMTGMSCSLYSPPARTRMQNLFQATCNLADTYVINGQTPWKGLDVTPWASLAWGYDWNLYRTDQDPSIPQPECYRSDWDYNLKYSRQIGAELNSFTPPYDRAKIIIFFPQLFYKWTAPWYDIDSVWGRHFVEYCKGATQ